MYSKSSVNVSLSRAVMYEEEDVTDKHDEIDQDYEFLHDALQEMCRDEQRSSVTSSGYLKQIFKRRMQAKEVEIIMYLEEIDEARAVVKSEKNDRIKMSILKMCKQLRQNRLNTESKKTDDLFHRIDEAENDMNIKIHNRKTEIQQPDERFKDDVSKV